MINHIHLLVQVPENSTIAHLMQKIKVNSARKLKPTLSREQEAQLGEQSGLSRKQFWQNGFRSTVVIQDAFFNQKVSYIEENPVRAGLVQQACEYRWSSLWLLKEGYVDRHGDLDFARAREVYAP
jgi:REP element-mobilizing transposase RayT